MAVSVKVVKSLDGDKIVAQMLSTWDTGLEMLSSQILADCNRYCKRDSGVLIMSSLIHSDLKHGRLVWQTPYAARQYYEIETAYTDRNSEASWRWCEVAESRHKAKWNKQAAAIVRYYKK